MAARGGGYLPGMRVFTGFTGGGGIPAGSVGLEAVTHGPRVGAVNGQDLSCGCGNISQEALIAPDKAALLPVLHHWIPPCVQTGDSIRDDSLAFDIRGD